MKNFKKILAAVSAAVLCTMPMANGVAVNATDSPQMKTYVVYTVATRPDIAYFDYTLYYSYGVISQRSRPLDLLSRGNFASIPKTSNYKVQHKYSGPAIGSTGKVASIEFVVSMDTESIYDKISRTSPDIRNANGDTLNPASLVMDEVLLGDVDLNGVVNEADADLILSYLVNRDEYNLTERQKDAADVCNRGDGVTSSDALTIEKYIYGQISHF